MADNPDERFDVVDASDRVVRQARRADVHANGWLHRAVHIFVLRANGDVFLQQRSMGKDSHPGRWDSSASGHLDSGEGYDAAAVRELREELGIEAEDLEHLGSLAASERTGWEFVHIYKTHHEGPLTLHPDEISGGRWICPAELDVWVTRAPDDFPPCFQEVWERVREQIPHG
jgi:isopentenyl-diphosphate delta-isomerase type 1